MQTVWLLTSLCPDSFQRGVSHAKLIQYLMIAIYEILELLKLLRSIDVIPI